MRLVVTSFSLSVDSLVAIGGVTPRNLFQDRCLWYGSGQCIIKLTLDCCPSMQVIRRPLLGLSIFCSRGSSNGGEKVADKRKANVGAYVIRRVNASTVMLRTF
jgi:hypothetical protein